MVEPIQRGTTVKDGEDFFREIFDAHYTNLCKYACTIVKDLDEAEDVVQSLFLKILEKSEEINMGSDVKPYLYRAVHNYCLNRIQHFATRRSYQEQSIQNNSRDVQGPEIFPRELEESIKDAINKLPPQCRVIFMMSRYREMKYSEIASELGLSVNTIENQISKALKVLRLELKDYHN